MFTPAVWVKPQISWPIHIYGVSSPKHQENCQNIGGHFHFLLFILNVFVFDPSGKLKFVVVMLDHKHYEWVLFAITLRTTKICKWNNDLTEYLNKY